MEKTTWMIIGLIVGPILLIGTCTMATCGIITCGVVNMPETTSRNGEFIAPRITTQEQVVTRDEFNQIQTDMTLQQVQSIIGATGEQLSVSDLMGIRTEMWSWMNSNGSNMNAMFQNDRLINKGQFGL